MRVVRMVKANNTNVYATVSSSDDISAATVAIALHDDTNADVWLTSTWDTTPTLNAATGLYEGEARTSSAVDFATKALGAYVVRVKVGTEITDCYVLKVIP